MEVHMPQQDKNKTARRIYMEIIHVLFTLHTSGKTRNGYLRRLNVSIKFWRTKGGCLSDDVIQKLIDAKVPIGIVDKSNYRTHKHPVKMEYQEDIDIPEFREIPTYKRMCICILRNDHACKYMGFSPTKEEISKKNKIMENYKNIWR